MKMLRNGFFVLLIMAVGFWVLYHEPLEIAESFKADTPKVTSTIKPATTSNETAKNISPIETKLHQEASLIGRIDSAPDDTEERLQSWAKSLNQKELELLEATALNIEKPQDDRFLAVMLMGWSEKAEALDNLKDIALAKIDPYLSPNRSGDFERVLRMQAVDGMIDLPAQTQVIVNTLQAVAAKTDDTTLADRANRALLAMQSGAPTPKEQEEKAYEELLKKNAKK